MRKKDELAAELCVLLRQRLDDPNEPKALGFGCSILEPDGDGDGQVLWAKRSIVQRLSTAGGDYELKDSVAASALTRSECDEVCEMLHKTFADWQRRAWAMSNNPERVTLYVDGGFRVGDLRAPTPREEIEWELCAALERFLNDKTRQPPTGIDCYTMESIVGGVADPARRAIVIKLTCSDGDPDEWPRGWVRYTRLEPAECDDVCAALEKVFTDWLKPEESGAT